MSGTRVEHNVDDATEVEYVDASVVTSLAKAEINQQIATARAFPRSVAQFSKEVDKLVAMNQQVAEECVYSLPRDGKIISGPSARMAEILASCWGNCRAGARVIDEDEHFVTGQGYFMDVERNVQIMFETKRRITTKSGARYSEDMVATTAAACCSIALRNAILRGIPKVFWISAYHVALKTIEGTQQTFEKTRDAALAFLKDKHGVTQAMVLAKFELKGVKDLTTDHVVAMRGIATTLKEGESTVEDLFGVTVQKPASGEAQAKATDGAAEPEVDYKKEFTALARKMGKTTPQQFYALVSLLFTEDLGTDPPGSYSAVAPSDWKAAYGAAMKRWDEEGKPRAQAVTLKVATSKSEAVVVEEFEEASFPETAPESIVARSPDPGPSDEIVRLQHGDPKALVDVGMQAEALFKTHNKRRRFIQEHPEGSGDVYFTDSPILLDCGSTREVDGKVVATPALLESTEHGLLVATEGLRIMLGRALRMAMDELEAPR